MGGMRHRRSSMTASSSPKPAKVCFAKGDVTGESRPPTNDESWTLYYFESHAAACDSCHEPLHVSRHGGRLCDEGHKLATNVTGLIFRDNDGKIYSRQESRRAIHVEIPHDYVETVSLLKAIQRGLRKGNHFIKPTSHDKTYFVRDRRIPERFAKTPEPAPRFETRLADPWSDHQNFHTRRDNLLRSFSMLQRGSHYGADMGELERAMRLEQRAPYNVELRVPSYFQPSHRSSVYV